jgi:hypothetical protein
LGVNIAVKEPQPLHSTTRAGGSSPLRFREYASL